MGGIIGLVTRPVSEEWNLDPTPFVIAVERGDSMTTLLVLGLMFFAAICSLVLIPLFLLKVAFTLVASLVVIPFQILASILGGLTKGLLKGMFWLALLLIPLALIALPFTLLALGGWILYRIFRPKRPAQAYVVA